MKQADENHAEVCQVPGIQTVEEYFDLADAADTRNPLISAFPDFNESAIHGLMANSISFSVQRRQHSIGARIGYAMGLTNLYEPLDAQLDFCRRLWALVLHGYRGRNPTSARRPSFASLMRDIRAGAPPKLADDCVADAMMSAVLIGMPGTGKSTTVKAFFRSFGGTLLHHRSHGDLYQLIAITVQAPKRGAALPLAKQVFDLLMEKAKLIPGPIPYRSGRQPRTTDEYIDAVVVLATKLNLGLLVIDELQNMFKGTEAVDEDGMKFLTGVINRLGIPILMIGTWASFPFISLETRLARRATSPSDGVFRRIEVGPDWDAFVGELISHQYVHNPMQADAHITARLYHHTQGIQDVAVKLFIACQCEAMVDRSETITIELIDRVADVLLARMKSSLEQIRRGKRDDDPTLWDLEPIDLDAHLKLFAAGAASKATRTAGAKHYQSVRTSAKATTLAKCLADSGAATEQDAATLATAAVSANPERPVPDHRKRPAIPP